MKSIFLILICFLVGCGSTAPRNLNNRTQIHTNMTKAEVLSILGAPRNRQHEGEWEKWVYYQPGASGPADKYFMVYFYKELVGETWESITDSPR